MGDDRRTLWLVMGALMTCLLLSALDQTIVSTALPTIVGDLGGLEHISWVVTAYLLSSTVSVPLFGKISDIYGRKPMLQATIVIFLVGSVLAGLSQNMLMLILFRGIQGIGGGGLLAMTFTILGDLITPRERGKYTGYFTAVFASSSVIGPLAGGFFVDHLSWRWVFYINLPLGAICLLVTGLHLHVPKPAERRPLDIVGSVLLTIAVTCLLLMLTWGGHQYDWGSGVILTLGFVGVVTGVVFLVQAGRTPDPVLPLRMFREPVFTVCIAMGALLGAVVVGAAVFLPLYLQVVKGASATSSGLLLVPMMGAMVIGSNTAGRIINRTGRYKMFPIVGSGLAVAGVLALTALERSSSRNHVSFGMAILGLGIGSAMPVTTLAVQNVASQSDMGAATSAVNFFRSLGSAFGIAVFGTAMSTRLNSTLERLLPGTDLHHDKGLLNSPAAIRALPRVQYAAVAQGITDGVAMVFRVALPIVIAAWVASWFLKEVPLREDLEASASMVEGMEEAGMVYQPAVEPAPTRPDDLAGVPPVEANGNGHDHRTHHQDVRPHS
ncbi:MAG: MFS transporter [Acidobacteria bacterium]|nr:MFS transporter [Acidobacteriota bacterium]